MGQDEETAPNHAREAHQQAGIDSRRREEALQSLAKTIMDQTAPSKPQRTGIDSQVKEAKRRTMRRAWWLLGAGGVVAILVLAVLVALMQGLPPSPFAALTPAPAALRIDVESMGYVCPAAVSWSPSGASFAVLAQYGRVTSSDANNPCAFSDTVLLFDSHTGKLQKAYPLAATLNHADGYISSPVALSWSPDATMIALPCAVANHRKTGWASDAGVLLVPISKGQPYIVHGFVDMTPSSQKSVVFNIKTGAVASSTLYPIPAASRYTVGADGRLVITRPFASARLDSADTGGPSGDSQTSASFWSSGALVGVSQKDGSNTEVVYYTATTALWSVDGAYVDPSLTFGAAGFAPDVASLTAIDPQQCANVVFVPCIATPVPYADRALPAVRAQTGEEAGAQPYQTSSPIAWSPNGKILATVYPANDFTLHSDTIRVTLLATNDAHVIKTLTTASSSSFNGGAVDLLAWAPSGNQLAFRDPVGGVVTVWGGSSLP